MKKQTNKKSLAIKAILFVLGVGIILGLIIAGVQNARTPKHHLSPRLEAMHLVTKTIQNAKSNHYGNVIIYDKQTNLKSIIASRKSMPFDNPDITLVMYSDGCKRCNKHKQELANWIVNHSNSKHIVIAVNDETNIKKLQKYFVLPDFYHYPSAYTYKGFTGYKPYQISERYELWKQFDSEDK